MSQHIFETKHNGKNVRIFAGWDRPLQGFFMMVEDLNAKDEDNPYIYTNFEEKVAHPPSFAPFIMVLNRLGITVPEKMVEEILDDGRLNVGNKHRVWTTS